MNFLANLTRVKLAPLSFSGTRGLSVVPRVHLELREVVSIAFPVTFLSQVDACVHDNTGSRPCTERYNLNLS